MDSIGIRPSIDWQWIIFAPNRKPNDFMNAIAKVVRRVGRVLLIDDFLSALQQPWNWPMDTRVYSVPGLPACQCYKILHTPERIRGISSFLRCLNTKRIVNDFDRLISSEDRLVVYDRPSQNYLVGRFRERLSIYIALDDMTLTVTGETIPGELEAERRLLNKVDVAICVSETLAQRLRDRSDPFRKPEILVVPNGYDDEIFNPGRHWPEPEGLRYVPRPRILVAGHISERIDWDGVIAASRLKPEWNWVFVGPTTREIKESMIKRLGLRGFFFPSVPLTDVPAWLVHSDACAVPYRLNPFTQASNPLKALEYLAMGKPVLSTRVPSLESYNAVVEWIDEGDGVSYVIALDKVIAQSNDANLKTLRRQAVANDTWTNRVCQFLEIVFSEVQKRLHSSENEIQNPFPSRPRTGREQSKELLA
jgi:glycosyltransferase involved in cell wall biosynthesis